MEIEPPKTQENKIKERLNKSCLYTPPIHACFYTGYHGMSINGVPNNQGTCTTLSGDTYKGQFRNGYPSGKGTLTSKDKFVFKGNFSYGHAEGHGYFESDNLKGSGIWKSGGIW